MLAAIDHIGGSARGPKTHADLVMPQVLAGPRVQRDDVSLAIPREHQSRGCRQHTGRGRGRIAEFPLAIAGQRVDRAERTEVLLVARLGRTARFVLFPLSKWLVPAVIDRAR